MPSPAEDPEGELGDSVQPQDPRMLRGFFLAQTLGPDPRPRMNCVLRGYPGQRSQGPKRLGPGPAPGHVVPPGAGNGGREKFRRGALQRH